MLSKYLKASIYRVYNKPNIDNDILLLVRFYILFGVTAIAIRFIEIVYTEYSDHRLLSLVLPMYWF